MENVSIEETLDDLADLMEKVGSKASVVIYPSFLRECSTTIKQLTMQQNKRKNNMDTMTTQQILRTLADLTEDAKGSNAVTIEPDFMRSTANELDSLKALLLMASKQSFSSQVQSSVVDSAVDVLDAFTIKDTEKQKDFDKRYANVKNEWPELIIAIEDLAQACREMTLEPLNADHFKDAFNSIHKEPAKKMEQHAENYYGEGQPRNMPAMKISKA